MNESPSKNGSEGDNSDSSYWYLRAGDRVVGPIMMSRLKQMGRQGKVAPENLVRQGKEGDWVAAGTVSGLLIREADDEAAAETEEEEVAVAAPRGPGLLSRLLESTLGGGAELAEGGAQWLADRLGSMRRVGSWVALAAVIIALAFTSWGRSLWEGWLIGSPLARMNAIANEMEQNRTSKASPAEWDAFAERAQRDVMPHLVRLEKSASAIRRDDQYLLWAGRDALPTMLADSREKAGPGEKQFRMYLQRAEWVRGGLDQYTGRRPYSRRMGWSLARFSLLEVGAAAFILVDIAVVGWLARSWLRRRAAA